MFEFFTISDWIQFIGVMVSFAVGIASIIIAVITLRQNSKMIAESTRPYIVVQFERAYTSTLRCYFVVKNYGQTGAKITDFKCVTEISAKFADREINYQIKAVKNTFLAPGQKLNLIFNETPNAKDVTFLIKYEANRKAYSDTILLHIPDKIPIVRGYSTQGNERNYLGDISNSIQEIVERTF